MSYFVESDSSNSEESDENYGITLHMQEMINKSQGVTKPINHDITKIHPSSDYTCPICMSHVKRGNKHTIKLRCSDVMHERCYAKWCVESFKCPKCQKIIDDVRAYKDYIDIECTKETQDTRTKEHVIVYCIECNTKNQQLKDTLRNKCAVCESYNTTLI